ncbi:uncharacterized protein LTHEOB_3526 [Lasiodiplodia theobromae]|uniref:uncharacterized protein n=1 Tax=Lasiodiplodia theobromae TaxID=45133 RepID=UPI0015C315D4|nr:uncharacterized protein LTHEOB_3526 [Lasiodiplodia theobromae]KAF4533913.1 hypothetical protein LTHEOB_3526 [Lasiodiplodia theobromae]
MSAPERDFSRDGVPASWADGQPSTWNSETSCLTLSRACITGSISPDEEFSAILIPGAIVIASLNTVTINQTIDLEGTESPTHHYHLEWQPGRQYALLFSTPDLTTLYQIDRTTLTVVASHRLENRAVPSLAATAFNPSGTRLVLQHKPNLPAESHLEVWTTSDTAPTLDATLDTAHTSTSTAATSWHPAAPLLAFSTLSSTTPSAPASASEDTTSPSPPLHIWDTTAPTNNNNNPHPLAPPPPHHRHLQPWRHAFSPCGTYIALSAGTRGLIWHAASGTLLADVRVAPAWWARCVPAWQPAASSLETAAVAEPPRVAFGGAGGAVTVVRLQARRGEDEEEVQAVVEQERREGQQGGGTMEVLAGEVGGVEWVDGGKGLVFDTGRNGGVEAWHRERNVKWRIEQPVEEQQQEKRKKGVVARWCEGRRMVVVLDRDVGVVRFWRMP